MNVVTAFGRLASCVLCGIAGIAVVVAPCLAELKDESVEKVDAVLVVDASGSMLLTDPLRLRDEGAKLFVQFLKPGDRLGIVSFSDKAEIVRPLSDFSSQQADEVEQALKNIPITGQYTDIGAGVRSAAAMLADSQREGVRQVVVLLSDGKLDPDPKLTTKLLRMEELSSVVLPELKAKGTKIYTLSFSEEADRDYLSQLAALTEGDHWFTPKSDRIHESFASLFLSVKKPQVVPLTSKGFRIDPDIQEATFYINRENVADVTIESPTGQRITVSFTDPNIKWYHGSKFDVVTVLEPEVGNWQVVGLPPNDSFATVLTNVKLVTQFPSRFNSADPVVVEAQLFEAEKPIILPQMTGSIRYAYQITPTDKISEPIIRDFLVDDGTNGDRRANDGIFSHRVEIEDEGEYRLRVVAQGPTFERNQQIPFRVKPRLVSISIASVEESPIAAAAPTGHEGQSADGAASVGAGVVDYARVQLSADAAELKRINVRLLAADAKTGKRYGLPLKQGADAMTYNYRTSGLPNDGVFKLWATLSGETKKGKEVKATSQVVEYTKAPKKNGEEEHVEEIQEKVEAKVEPPSALPYILIITIINGAVGYVFFGMLKKLRSSEQLGAPAVALPAGLVGGIADLEAQAAVAEVNFQDPRFSVERIKVRGQPATKAATPAVDSPAAEPAPEQASAPEAATTTDTAEQPSAEESEATPETTEEG